MMALIEAVLEREDLDRVMQALADVEWRDGKATAGAMAKGVKNNAQATPSPDVDALQRFVAGALLRHPVFQLAVRPARLSRLIFSRYEPGQHYGAHTDDALMVTADGARLRTDIAFTLFLAEPETYQGGALAIESPAGEQSIKLSAGSVVVYPAGTIHQVQPVTQGARLACVGWAQSLIRDPAARELLFDLATVRKGLEAPRERLLLLDKTISNLLRMWAEP